MRSQPYGHELFDRLRSMALPVGEYVTFGRGPLLVRGIVEGVTDLDVLCQGEAWLDVQRLATCDLDLGVRRMTGIWRSVFSCT